MNILEFLGLQESDIRDELVSQYKYNKDTMLVALLFKTSDIVDEYVWYVSKLQCCKQIEVQLYNSNYHQWLRFRKQKGFLI